MPVNPYEKYKQQSVMTMTQGEMLTKLYDEVIKQLSGAVMFIEEKNISKVNDSCQRAQRILNYLKQTLDFKYDISNNLAALYDFFIQKTIEANIKKDVAPINDILPMIEDLKDTFVQAEKLARKH